MNSPTVKVNRRLFVIVDYHDVIPIVSKLGLVYSNRGHIVASMLVNDNAVCPERQSGSCICVSSVLRIKRISLIIYSAGTGLVVF